VLGRRWFEIAIATDVRRVPAIGSTRTSVAWCGPDPEITPRAGQQSLEVDRAHARIGLDCATG